MALTSHVLLLVITEDWYFLSHRLALARAAQRRGMRVVVATAPGQRSAELRALGIDHRTFALERRGIRPGRELRTVAELQRLIATVQPSIVHLVAAKPIVYGNIAARLAGQPPVLSAVAGLGYLYLGGGLQRRALRAAYEQTLRTFVHGRAGARVLVQNLDDAALLLERRLVRPEQLVCVTGAGVDVERFRCSPEPSVDRLVVLCHTRMLWDKGVGELVEAARLLRERGKSFVLRLVGEPDLANPTAIAPEQLKAWASSGLVEWLGARQDIPEQLARCHIACLPSYREGAPLSLLEAAAAGRAIVTTDVPGCRAVVSHGVNGLLVPPRDASALAAALERLLSDPEERKLLGRAGRTRAEREFATSVVNDRILRTYEEMLELGPT